MFFTHSFINTLFNLLLHIPTMFIIDTHKFEFEERNLKNKYESLRKNFTKKIKKRKSEENIGLLQRFIWFHSKKNEL